MKAGQAIKEKLALRKLRKTAEPMRNRTGFNFHSADRVGIIYEDSDEPFYKKLRDYAAFLKSTYSLKSVFLLGYIPLPDKQLPPWQQHKLESEYFTKSEVNWQMQPSGAADKFVRDEFDMLIDLSSGNSIPLNFVMKQSRAKMKVGIAGTRSASCCDLIINLGDTPTIDQFVKQLNTYLSNPKIV
jgi:hypothetical protein